MRASFSVQLALLLEAVTLCIVSVAGVRVSDASLAAEILNDDACSHVIGAKKRESAWRRYNDCKCPKFHFVTGEAEECKTYSGKRYFPSKLNAASACTCESDKLEVAIDSGPDDAPIVLFVHGWPDNPNVWSKQIEHFNKSYRCIAVRLPGYGESPPADRPWGYDFDELAVMLTSTARAVGKGKPVVFVAHDWGAWITYMVERVHPELFRGLISFDVGPAKTPPWDVIQKLMSYQFAAIKAFMRGGSSGDRMIRNFVLNELPPLAEWGAAGTKLSPTPLEEMTAYMGYPYYHAWAHGTPANSKFITEGYQGWDADNKTGELPKCPTLFLYGVAGIRGLSGDEWCNALNARPGSKAVPFDSHHWLMYTNATAVNAEIETFLNALS